MPPAMVKPKIVATLGPASESPPVLKRMMQAGVDVVRLNLSHGTQDEHARMLKNVRAVAAGLKTPIAVMADLCGPKIRVGKIEGGSVLLVEGAEIRIQRKTVVGNAARISTTVGEIVDAARAGHRIRLDDGKIELLVRRRVGRQALVCEVISGGMLSSGKGVNLPQTNLKLSALTEKDRRDVRWLVKQDVDYVALSFVQRAGDIRELRKLLTAGGCDARIIAKIEKPQAVKNIDHILKVTDGIMVARGDLGVEMSLPEVPVAQKRLVRRANAAGKICIIATQMLETMTTESTPTRAEVSDVANAILDGADAVMLSGETAVGKHPHKVVQMMNRIIAEADGHVRELRQEQTLCPRQAADALAEMPEALRSIARAVGELAGEGSIKAVVVLTISGNTAVALSKMRLGVPLLALTRSARVTQQMSLLYGTDGAEAPICRHTRDVLEVAGKEVRARRWASKGDQIVVVSGRPLGESGTINTLVVHTV